jgi:thiol-disulfide isomerase/thioredoxin
MEKVHRPARIPRLLVEWIICLLLITVGGYLFSRILLRANSTQTSSSVATSLPTSIPIGRVQTEQTGENLTAITNIQRTPVALSSGENSGDLFDTMLIGEIAPNFTLPTLNGSEVRLSDLRGQAIWINFWASWCEPCRIEMPLLVAAFDSYRDDGLVILGLNITEQDTLDAVNSFVDEFDVSYPIVLDEQGHISTDSYNLIGLPMSVFIDRAGVIKRVVVGAVSEAEIDPFVVEIVGETANAH